MTAQRSAGVYLLVQAAGFAFGLLWALLAAWASLLDIGASVLGMVRVSARGRSLLPVAIQGYLQAAGRACVFSTLFAKVTQALSSFRPGTRFLDAQHPNTSLRSQELLVCDDANYLQKELGRNASLWHNPTTRVHG